MWGHIYQVTNIAPYSKTAPDSQPNPAFSCAWASSCFEIATAESYGPEIWESARGLLRVRVLFLPLYLYPV